LYNSPGYGKTPDKGGNVEKQEWIPAFAGMTETVILRDGSVSSKTVTPAPGTATSWIWKNPQEGGI